MLEDSHRSKEEFMQTDAQFTQESQLVEMLKPSVRRLLRTSLSCSCESHGSRRSRPIVMEQVPVGMTIPDLLIVRRCAAEDSWDTKNVSYFDSSVLTVLQEKGPCSSEFLAEALFSRMVIVLSSLERLARLGTVSKAETGEFFLIPSAFPDVTVISIEAKLYQWREALAQAKSYMVFSDYAYMALPEGLVNSNRSILPTCEQEGIGLISVSSRLVRVVVSAEPNAQFNQERFWLISRIPNLERRQSAELSPSRRFSKEAPERLKPS